jgi:predicted ArsR family transcriptional regulator
MNHHPQTSLTANRMVTDEMRNEHYKKIIEGLGKLEEATSEEIASITTLSKDQIYRRMIDLVRMDKVFSTGRVKLTRSGRPASTYQLVKNDSRGKMEEGKLMFIQNELFQ